MNKIKENKNIENIKYIIRKTCNIGAKLWFKLYYNWRKIVVIGFLLAVLYINNNIQIPVFINEFFNFLSKCIKTITFNKVEIPNICWLYILEIILLVGLIYLLVDYFGLKNKHQKELGKIKRFRNAKGKQPYLTKRKRSKTNYKVLEETYNANGIPLKEWKEKQEDIETATNRVILNIKEIEGSKNKVFISSISPKYKVAETINWQDDFISNGNFELVLGENLLEKIMINLNKTPHILLGGTTGSGKTILLNNLIYQCYKKGAIVYIADLKGVDFSNWNGISNINVITNVEKLYDILDKIEDELLNRQIKFQNAGVKNIDEYNLYTNECCEPLKRIVFVCDEVAEIFSDDDKKIKIIESILSKIARLGRAFGIHLILSTQRPDSKILEGQIKSNLDVRICGRADRILSEVVLGKGNTDADELIPKDKQGLFITNNGKRFKGYLFDDDMILKEKQRRVNDEYTSNI